MSDGASVVGVGIEEPQPDRRGSWLVEELHLTAAYETPQPTSLVRDWWTAATDLHPEQVVENPLIGAVQLEGVVGKQVLQTNLVVRTELSRLVVTWQYGDRLRYELYPALDDVRRPFVDFVTRWLGFKTVPPIQRLGFGGSLVKLFPRIEDCRDELDRLLPAVDMQVAASLDFLYQGNRRCAARTVEGLTLNRIAKWRIRMPPPVIQLDLDMNTASDRVGSLDRLPDMLGELVGYADRFVEEGDRP